MHCLVGWLVQPVLGSLLETPLGALVGALVGPKDGAVLGGVLGAPLGVKLGAPLGALVGGLVGFGISDVSTSEFSTVRTSPKLRMPYHLSDSNVGTLGGAPFWIW